MAIRDQFDGIPDRKDDIGDHLMKIWRRLGGNPSAASNASVPGLSITGLKGEAGGVIETGTTAITGDFEAIQCLADTVLASYTSSTLTGDSLVAVTLPAGTIIYGRFSAFTLTSGKVIAYNKN